MTSKCQIFFREKPRNFAASPVLEAEVEFTKIRHSRQCIGERKMIIAARGSAFSQPDATSNAHAHAHAHAPEAALSLHHKRVHVRECIRVARRVRRCAYVCVAPLREAAPGWQEMVRDKIMRPPSRLPTASGSFLCSAGSRTRYKRLLYAPLRGTGTIHSI